jgi:hypothetical protein
MRNPIDLAADAIAAALDDSGPGGDRLVEMRAAIPNGKIAFLVKSVEQFTGPWESSGYRVLETRWDGPLPA